SGNFDTLVFPGPYQFNLKYRAGSSNTFTTIFNSTQNMLYQLDTSYIHQNVNTVATDQEYMVEFIAGTVTIGSSQKATSVFLSAAPGDRRINLSWSSVTPWNNYKYTVYRKDPGSSSFVATATTSLTHYKDSVNIANRATYCYKILSEGKYSDTTIYKPLLNNSQEVCATAVDNTPPCTPSISIVADCPAGYVNVEWNDVTKSCGDDVVKYLLYKKETVDEDYVLIATINTPSNTSYTFDGLALINSCFAIQAVDSSGNVSPFSQDYCVDNCPEFELPNIVTLNNDGINDYFKAIKVRQIKQIDLYIYDRWGNLVYKTTDPYFKWNCVSILTNKAVSEGTFFYICDVYEPRVEGVKKRNLKGYMQVVK
ncbi:MAG: T9SS type B sorting domain-containing protein, partial [Bacteroidia bacterium]